MINKNMAKDVFVNILDLGTISQVNDGDYLIVETPNGTRIIDFKDFIVPNKNLPLTTTVDLNTTQILSTNDTVTTLGTNVNTQVSNLSSVILSVSAQAIGESSTNQIEFNTKINGLSASIDSLTPKFDETMTNTLSTVDKIIYVGTAQASIAANNINQTFALAPTPPDLLTVSNISISPANAYATKNMAYVSGIDPNSHLVTITGVFSGNNPATEVATYNILAVYKSPTINP